MLVNNKSGRVTTVAGLRMVPGVNQLADKEWAEARKILKNRVGEDFVEVTEKGADGKGGPVEFSKLDPKQAALVVESTKDPSLLESWLKAETRESVRAAIVKQQSDLTPK